MDRARNLRRCVGKRAHRPLGVVKSNITYVQAALWPASLFISPAYLSSRCWASSTSCCRPALFHFSGSCRRHRAHRSSADNSPRGLIFSHELARGIPRRYPYTRPRSRPPISRWSCRACAPDTTNQPTLAVLISCRSGSWATKAPLRVAAQVNPAEYGEPEPLALVRVPQRNHAPLTPPSSGSPRGTCCRRRRAPARPSTVVAGPGTASAAQNRVAVDVWCPGTRDRDRMAAPAALGAGTAATRASWPSRKAKIFGGRISESVHFNSSDCAPIV